MTSEEIAELLKAAVQARPQVTQTLNFNAPVGQQIAHVDKIEAHFDKDIGIMFANDGKMANGAQDELPMQAGKPRPGARKQFLFIGKKATEENVGVKNCEKERFLRYLREHKMSSKRLVTEKNDGLNKVVVCFLKQWAEKGLTAEQPSGGAVFRFLTADCGLETDVEEKSYGNKIAEWFGANNYDITTYQGVKACFS